MRIKSVVLVLFVLCLCYSPLLAQETDETCEIQVSQFPCQATVDGDRVNVRSGPGLKYDILKTLNFEEIMVVMGEDGEWYSIKVPDGVILYVHSKYVQSETQSMFPFEAEVTAGKLKVRPRPNTKQKEMGVIYRGTVVNVLAKKGEFFAITPPEGVFAFISSRYAKLTEGAPLVINETGQENETSEEVEELVLQKNSFEVVDQQYLEEIKKDPLEWNFDEIETEYKTILTETNDERLHQIIDGRMIMIDLRRQLQSQQKATVEAENTQSEELDAVMEKYDELKSAVAALEEASLEPEWLCTGWVKSVGRYFNRPAAYKVSKGDQTLFFIEAAEGSGIDFNDYAQENVGIMGEVVERNGAKVILVSSVEILAKK